MKKLALSLLFSTALIIHKLSPVGSITELGPVKIITTNGSNAFAPGTVSLYGTINIGQSTSDVITLMGDGITYPGVGLESFLMIDSNGKVITASGGGGSVTFGSLSAALNTGQSITFGSASPTTNYFNLQNDTGDIILQSMATNSNLHLAASNNIVLVSSNIVQPISGVLLLSVDGNGNVSTVNPSSSTVSVDTINANSTNAGALSAGTTVIGGDLNASTISGNVSLGNISGTINLYVNGIQGIANGATAPLAIDNNGLVSIANQQTNMNIGSLTAASDILQTVSLGTSGGANNFFGFTNNSGDVTLQANKTGSSLLLSADSYITLNGFGLTTPGILTLDNNNHLATASSSSSLTCGTFTAGANSGNTITLGIDNPTHNSIAFTSDSGSMSINAGVTGSTLDLSANAGILLSGSELNLTFPTVQSTLNLDGYVVLAVDRSNNLITSNSTDVFKMGNDNSGNNFISVDNANPSNGILLSGQALYLANPGLTPASGYTNLLTIDSTGKIGIVVSTKTAKDNIQKIKLDESFNSLVPVSYSYKGNNHLEYGFIAEDLAKIPALQNAVIYGQDGKPMSVNYQNVFVAVTADHFQVKDEVQMVKEELERVKAQYNKMEAIISQMITQGILPTL